ncbi:energy-coupling factor transporter transmembrane component T [Bifidobacterium asteroides]|uniref:energy-coupling factor transporter transmembrane component T n=1 Tax=Bifidobacterium asteroides TaxID=1684 RepID=UPI003A8098DA
MPGPARNGIPDSPLARMHPMAKIAGVCSLGLATLAWPDFTLGLGIIVMLFIAAALARVLRPFSGVVLGFGIPVTLMLLFIQGCYSPRNTKVVLDLGFAQLGLEGSLYAAKIVVTLLVFLGSFYLTNKTTYMGRLVAALTQIGVPSKIGYLILASLNVVPQMQRRIAIIEQSQHARGLETGGGLISRARAFLPLLGPVVLSSLTDSQERGMTLETRGFGIRGVRQTSYLEVVWRRSDTVMTILFTVFLVLALVLGCLSRAGLITFAIQWGGRA